jgi:glycosyltransferase involved in cell wall biosynthesis
MAPDGRRLPRVVFTIGGLLRGGSEIQLVNLLERLHGTRLDAKLVTLSPAADPALLDRLGAAGVEIDFLSPDETSRPRRMVASGAGLAAVFLRHRPGAAYAWLEEAALVTAPFAKLTRTPLVVARRNVNGAYAGRRNAVVRAIHRAERAADVVTVNSRAVGEESLARGVGRSRIRLVANGHAVLPALPPPAGTDVALGYVARFRPEKGHGRLLEALSRVRTAVPWHVDLAGSGPLQAQIEDEVRRRGLQARVRFVGELEDPRSFWADRHVAALLSDHEGSPNALIEAAMSGRPMVATAVGGVPDVVASESGTLVGTHDPEATAAALVRFIEDADLRRRAGEAAHRHAVEQFSMDRSVEGHWAALAEVLGR